MLWDSYFEKTKDNAPSPYLQKAISLLPPDNRQTALDLGSGGGRDAKFLVSKGFEVTCVDTAPMAVEYIPKHQATFVRASFNEFPFGHYNIINASYSLPFIDASDFATIWQRITAALLPGGIFVGELFGARDAWNTLDDNRMNFHTRTQVEDKLSNLHVHLLDEEEGLRPTISGQRKFWHVYHIIAQRTP